MKNDLSCGVVRDLLPSYAEGLTGPESRAAIEKHLAECADCRGAYARMCAPEEPEQEEEERELDYLRGVRRRNRRRVGLGVLLALAAAALACFVAFFIVGRETPAAALGWQTAVQDDLVITDLYLLDSSRGIRSVEWRESEPGVVELTVRSALISPFSQGSVHEEYKASQSVTKVLLDGDTIWENGQNISREAAQAFACVHPYLGDASANVQLAQALGVSRRLGFFTGELHTEEEPYGWTLQLSEELTAADKEAVTAFSYLLLAGVGNLGWVEWDCVVDGQRTLLRMDREQASAWAGRDIKDCAASAAALQQTMNSLPAINGSYYGSDGENALYLRVINRTECEAYGLEIAFYLDGQLKTSGGAINADGSPLSEGEMMTLDFMEPDLAGAELQGHELSFELSVLDREEQPHRLEQTFSLPDPYFGKSYTCVLTGSFDQGFELTFLQ